MKKTTIFFVALLALFFLGLLSHETVLAKEQTTCPVMGDKISCLILDKDIYIDYDGKRIYFCSHKCLEKFKKNPEKYINKMKDQGVMFEKAPDAKPGDGS